MHIIPLVATTLQMCSITLIVESQCRVVRGSVERADEEGQHRVVRVERAPLVAQDYQLVVGRRLAEWVGSASRSDHDTGRGRVAGKAAHTGQRAD